MKCERNHLVKEIIFIAQIEVLVRAVTLSIKHDRKIAVGQCD